MIWIYFAIPVLEFLIITTIVSRIRAGFPTYRRIKEKAPEKFMITVPNRIDLQENLECSAYSSAYLLRHLGHNVNWEKLYSIMPNKLKSGNVLPKGVVKLLKSYGAEAKLCKGNINTLKWEINKGAPVIVNIKVRTDKSWMHFVPVVGYDEEYFYLSDSLGDLANEKSQYYNRKIKISDFKRLWHTETIYMPFYSYFYISLK